MEAPKFPFGNTLTPIGVVATLGFRFFGEWMTVAQWWQDLPWAYAAVFLIGVFIGQTWADLVNPRSQLIRYWRHSRRSYDFIAMPIQHFQDGRERVEVWAVIKFIKNLKNPTLVVKVKQLGPGKKQTVFVVHKEQLPDVVEGEEKRIKLGHIRIPVPNKKAFHSVYGSSPPSETLAPSQHSIIGGNKEVVEITIAGSSKRFYAQPIIQGHAYASLIILNEEFDPLFEM